MATSLKAVLSSVSLFLIPVFSEAGSFAFHGLVSSESWLPRAPVALSATGEQMIEDASRLPTHWDWRNVSGKSFVTVDVNQHIPQYCGCCWVHGTVAQINDRIKIARVGAFPDVMVSRQALMNCVEGPDAFAPGCFGGDSWMIYKYMYTHKVPDETCAPYRAQNDKCEPSTICRNCKPPPAFVTAIKAGKNATEILALGIDMTEECYAVPHWIGYGVKEYGAVSGELSMMKEIYARGPISCTMDASDDFMLRYAEIVQRHDGVFVTDEVSDTTDHVVEVTGWGITPSGLRYWVVRNSWGTYWGQAGWFKLRRGVDQLLIESNCTWSIPDIGDARFIPEGKILGDYVSGIAIMPEAIASGLAAQTWNARLRSWVALLTVAFSSAVIGAIFAVTLYRARQQPSQAPLLG